MFQNISKIYFNKLILYYLLLLYTKNTGEYWKNYRSFTEIYHTILILHINPVNPDNLPTDSHPYYNLHMSQYAVPVMPMYIKRKRTYILVNYRFLIIRVRVLTNIYK